MAKKPRLDRGLPAELEYQILLRLPVKTLCRFKCACKSWCSLISSPEFQQEHDHLSQNNPLLLIKRVFHCTNTLHLSTYTDKIHGLSLVNRFTKQVPKCYPTLLPIQSCRGLVCLGSNKGRILLCNPSTQELIALPRRPAWGESNCIGFGYSASSNKFKVVRFLNGDNQSCCEVFTLGTTAWRESTPPPYRASRGTAPFLHGALHLLPSRWYNVLDEDPQWYNVLDEDHIAAFDVESEKYKKILLPKSYSSESSHSRHSRRLVELRGSLCLCRNLDLYMDIWLLKDYHKSEWVKEHNIYLFSLIDGPLAQIRISADPLAIMDDGTILINVCGKKEKETELVCYDPRAKVVKQKIETNCSATFYMDSFFPLAKIACHGKEYTRRRTTKINLSKDI